MYQIREGGVHLDALSLRSNVMSSVNILSHGKGVHSLGLRGVREGREAGREEEGCERERGRWPRRWHPVPFGGEGEGFGSSIQFPSGVRARGLTSSTR